MLATGCQVNELLTATQTPTATHSNTYINCRTGASLKLQQGLEGATEQQGGRGWRLERSPKVPQKRRGYSRKVRQAHYNSSGVERQTTDEEWGRVGQGGALAYKCNHFVVQTSKTKSEIGKTKGQRRERGCGPTSWLPPFVDCGSRSHSWSRSCALRPTDWPASPPFRKGPPSGSERDGLAARQGRSARALPAERVRQKHLFLFRTPPPPCRPSVRWVGYPLSAIREVHAELARNRLQLHQFPTLAERRASRTALAGRMYLRDTFRGEWLAGSLARWLPGVRITYGKRNEAPTGLVVQQSPCSEHVCAPDIVVGRLSSSLLYSRRIANIDRLSSIAVGFAFSDARDS